MQFAPTPPLKPFNSSERPGVAPAALPTTKLSASDYKGVAAKLNPLSLKAGVNTAPVDANAKHEELVKTTEKWVAQSFFGTLMKQMRNSPFKSDLFEGGHGGKAFQDLHDQRLVDHMSRGAGKKLVASLVRKIENKNKAVAAYDKQKKAAADAARAVPAGAGAAPARSRQAADDASNPYRNVRVHVAPGL